ncbi:MAG TPA: PQQ-binding-like beta-propeller repeat protein [Cyclobacteriaceae bacterium]|nr:PQQ-binding-like beta-propeller repeat protein [Cyclobacteriaceae bacterium]
MKKNVVLIFLLLAMVAQLSAQSTFPKAWESKFDNDADYMKYTTLNGEFVIGTTKENVCVLDGKTGTQLWSKSFMELTGVNKAGTQQVLEDAGMLMFISSQNKKDQLFCVDLKTGTKLWNNANYNDIDLNNVIFLPQVNSFMVVLKKGLVLIDAKTGVEKGAIDGITGVPGRWVFLPEKKQLIVLCYEVNSLKAIRSGLQNHILCIDLEKVSTVWKTTFKGVVEIKRYASRTFTGFDWVLAGVEKGIGSSNVLVDVYTYNNKLVVVYNGLKVFDLGSGNKVWEVEYDVSLSRGLAGSAQMYGAVADPFFTEKHVYVASFEAGRDKSIKKYDMETGKLIWETPVAGRKVIIPSLALVNNVLVAQIGGYVNLQGEANGAVFSKWEWEGPFGLKGFDGETGKLLWETEKFDDRITNVLPVDNALYVADASNLYSVDVKTGSNNFSSPMKGSKTGKPLYLFAWDKKPFVFAEGGLASFTSSGSLAFAYKSKDPYINDSEQYGSTYFMANDDGLYTIDLKDGTEQGKYEYMKGVRYGIKQDGKSLFLLGEKKVTKHTIQ